VTTISTTAAATFLAMAVYFGICQLIAGRHLDHILTHQEQEIVTSMLSHNKNTDARYGWEVR